MEAYVLVICLAVSFILTLLSTLGSKVGWNMLAYYGSAIAVLTTLVLMNDGDLTWLGTPLASANGNFISDFNLISAVPGTVAIAEFTVGVRRTFHI